MSRAGNKDSSSPAASLTPTSVTTASLSSQSATLRVTSEGLNIVGEGGVLGNGRDSGSQQDQKQKFFATRSADGSWNLLMSKASDPSRLFLVRPAPGHRFQMTGGKVRMESADSTSGNKFANGSSSNGVEEDPKSLTSSPESAEHGPGTSKTVSVPVAQLRASSGISTLASSHMASVLVASDTATASAEAMKPSDAPEPKRPSFFKSRTAKYLEALKASAQHVVGKKVLLTNRKGSKASGGAQAGQGSKQAKKLKSVQIAKSHRTISPFTPKLQEHSFGTVCQSNSVPVDMLSQSSDLAHKAMNSSSLLSVPTDSGQVKSVLECGSDGSLLSSSLGNNLSSVLTPVTSLTSGSSDHLMTSTPQIQSSPQLNSSSSGGDNDVPSSSIGKTVARTCEKHLRMMDEECMFLSDGFADDNKADCVDSLCTLAENVHLIRNSETEKSLQCHGGSGEAVIDAGSVDGTSLLQGKCYEGDVQAATSSGESLAGAGIQTSKEVTLDELQTDATEKNVAAAELSQAGALQKKDNFLKDMKGKEKKTERKERFEFSSDTDDYEFIYSDSEKDAATEEVDHNKSVVGHSPKNPSSADGFITEESPKIPSADGDFVVEESKNDFSDEKDSATETERDSIKLTVDSSCTSPSSNLETASHYESLEHHSDAERPTSYRQKMKTSDCAEIVCENENVNEAVHSREEVRVILDSAGIENDDAIESRDKTLQKLAEEGTVGGENEQSSEAPKWALENGFISDISVIEQWSVWRKQKKRKSEVNALALECSGQHPAAGGETDITETRAKKGNKRKSELENIVDMFEDTGQANEQGNSVDMLVSGAQGLGGQSTMCLDVDNEQETVSNSVPTSVLRSTGSDTVTPETEEKQKHQKKIKLCIVSNSGSESADNVISEELPTLSTRDIPASDSACEPSRTDSQFLHQTELALTNDQQGNLDVLDSIGERHNINTERSQKQNGKSVSEVEVCDIPVEKNKKDKKKRKKLKIVFGSRGESSTRELPISVNINSISLKIPEDRNENHMADVQDSDTPDVTQDSAPPEADERNQPILSDGVQKKKKRKKRLSELETLIHDQQAYVSHAGSIDEVSEQTTDDTYDTHSESETPAVTMDRQVSFRSQLQQSSENKGLETSQCSGDAAELTSVVDAPESPDLGSLSLVRFGNASLMHPKKKFSSYHLPKQVRKVKKNVLHAVSSKMGKAMNKKKKKKSVSPGVHIIPPITLGSDLPSVNSGNTIVQETSEVTPSAAEENKEVHQVTAEKDSVKKNKHMTASAGIDVILSSDRPSETSNSDLLVETSSSDMTVAISSNDMCVSTSNSGMSVATSSSDTFLATSNSDISVATSSSDKPPDAAGGTTTATEGNLLRQVHQVTAKKDKVKRRKKKKQMVTAGVIVMPPITSSRDMSLVTTENDMPKITAGNELVASRSEMPEVTSASATDALMNSAGIEPTGKEDLNTSFSSESSVPTESDSMDISDTGDDDDATANRAHRKFLTSRSFCRWELERMFGTPFVVLERLSDQDIFFMSRRFRNARVSGRARCSAHCRLRTLDYLCELNIIKCKPPQLSEMSKGETGDETVQKKKKRKRKYTKESEQDRVPKKRKKRKESSNEKGKNGDVIILSKSSAKAMSTTSSNSPEKWSAAATTPVLPVFPSATMGRIRISQPAPPIMVSSSPAITSLAPRLIPAIPASGASAVPHIYTIPPLGTMNRPTSLPQVITISSLGAAINSANKILIPPLLVKSTTSSLREATRASLTQAISNSLGKARLVTPVSLTPVVATAAPVMSSASLPRGPIVVQAASASQTSVLPKGPILVQATAPASAPVLAKGPIVVQATMALSTTTPATTSIAAPKQFIVVQMGNKRVLVPTSALTTVNSTTPTVLSTTVPPVTTTVTASTRPVLQTLVSSQPSAAAAPAPAFIAAPSSVARQPSSLIPGSMARIVLSNRRPTLEPAPRMGPAASTLLFANRAVARPNQAWAGPRSVSSVDSHRRLVVTPGSQPQGVRVVLSGATPLPTGARFTVSSAQGGVLVASRQAGSMVRLAAPRHPRPGKRVMTEEERLRKRARLEKKYPLPPGVVIKTEPDNRGYSDEAKTTQANSSSRVYVSSVPVGSGARGQVNLSEAIPVLSTLRGNPIVIRQAMPASSTVPRSPTLLGPLIIRMPSVAASTGTSSVLAPTSTSAVTVMTASSLLSSLCNTSTSTTTTTATLPLTYSLLTGSTAVRASSTSATVAGSKTLGSAHPPQTSSVSISISSAPVFSVSSASTAAVPAGACQQTNTEEDAIYIADSPQADVQVSETENPLASSSQVRVMSPSATSYSTSAVTCSSVTPSSSSSSSSSASSSLATTTVAYTSQSSATLTSTTLSTPSSRMASLGALWVRQATESPNNIPSIATSSLQSDRMQRLKEFLAKQMAKGDSKDDRRQKALELLHRQFFQTVVSCENTSSRFSESASDTGENSCGSDPSCQETEAAETGRVDNNESMENDAAETILCGSAKTSMKAGDGSGRRGTSENEGGGEEGSDIADVDASEQDNENGNICGVTTILQETQGESERVSCSDEGIDDVDRTVTSEKDVLYCDKAALRAQEPEPPLNRCSDQGDLGDKNNEVSEVTSSMPEHAYSPSADTACEERMEACDDVGDKHADKGNITLPSDSGRVGSAGNDDGERESHLPAPGDPVTDLTESFSRATGQSGTEGVSSGDEFASS